VAFDTGGRAAVENWIRPALPIETPPPLQNIMGWSAEQYARQAPPTYPCLIDERHVVPELYNMTNVPMAVWINEAGRMVRPVEPTGATDGFRTMDRATFAMKPEVAAQGRLTRQSYVNALRDWVAKGDASPYALVPDELRARMEAPSPSEALGNANFRLGQYLRAQGHQADAQRYFETARRLCPHSWHFVRQALELEEVGKASSPEFFAAVDSLGDRAYYPPIDLTPKAR
jgi:hypothetical protein